MFLVYNTISSVSFDVLFYTFYLKIIIFYASDGCVGNVVDEANREPPKRMDRLKKMLLGFRPFN